jgi:hypothetical protein
MPNKETGTIAMPIAHAADLLIYAFRYALGRRTYSTSTMSEHLRTYWDCLPRAWQELVQREVREAIASGCAGDQCDIQSWETLLPLPLKAE